ncbi:uncharacterized protein LOC127789011 [Diospyros lotus]|uniref:uncharacterized protein LOC127789011 n=1 Tax=Diospyros lotus TaxID=55363 RepID=UPI002257A6CA|nr:uncharacterized protein LOC127789011 [Diospyros lotus]
MGMMMRKELACLSLILLMLIELELSSPCFAEGYYNRFKGGTGGGGGGSSAASPKPQKGFKRSNGDQDDDLFGADKRKVYTGPNPLHNR